MAPSPTEELKYLKSLVDQLNEKIKSLEDRAKSAVSPKSPAEQLRMILIGPPGAGMSDCFACFASRPPTQVVLPS